jgi:hypothetical protein
MAEIPMHWKEGGCHCGAVRFEVFAPDEPEIVECNCSVCRMTGFFNLIVPREHFRLRAGEDSLTNLQLQHRARPSICSTPCAG